MFVNVEYAESNSSYVLEMSQRSSIQESTSDVEFHSPTLENVMVLDNDVGQESKQWDQEIGCMTHEQIMSLNSAVMHDEAIGIITMEDLMEELLQVSIVLLFYSSIVFLSILVTRLTYIKRGV
jgi:hypothetical protein